MNLPFYRLDDVGDVDQLVVPGLYRREGEVGHLHHIRDDAARDRRDRLLAQCGVRNGALVDLVAARLLVIGDHREKGGVFLGNKALGEPHLRGRGRGVGDIGPRQGSGSANARELRSTERRVRLIIPASFPVRVRSPTRSGCISQRYYRTAARRAQMLSLETAVARAHACVIDISRRSFDPCGRSEWLRTLVVGPPKIVLNSARSGISRRSPRPA